MANIKFSQFTVGNTQSDIDFVVGYKGPDNVQISPTNLLASSLGNYLPLAGGTMTGDTLHNDSVEAQFGNSGDFIIKHTGDTYLSNTSGDMYLRQQTNDGDMIFQCDDGSGGDAEYFRLDGGIGYSIASKDIRFDDGVKAKFGTSNDLQIYHDGSNSIIENSTGILNINSGTTDTDANFNSSDPSVAVNFIASDNSMQIATSGQMYKNNGRFTFSNGGD